ncbi:MAG: RNA polymerase sigma factor [Acidimicrobiales bacterium]
MNGYEDVGDAELWALAAGEPEAFGELFRRHARSVYAFCYWRTGNPTLAEDLTSVVFLEAWRRRRLVSIVNDSALPWLFGVAVNSSRNAARSLRRHRAALARLPDRREGDVDDAMVDRLDAEMSLVAARDAMGDLSEPEREVVYLVLWSGLTYAEAATALGVPVGTVRSRVSRTRRKLQLALTHPTDSHKELL